MTNNFPKPVRLGLLYAGASLCLLLLSWSTWINARDGLGSFWTQKIPADGNGLARVERAQRLSPGDARAPDVRGRHFLDQRNFPEAVRSFEVASALRPHDYRLWLRLGFARESMGDLKGAIAAYETSIRLAPNFSAPHWYIGSLYLGEKDLDRAFAEFRRTASIDPKRYSTVIAYAWRTFGYDTEAVHRAVQPTTQGEQFALIHSFIRHEKIAEAMALYRSAGPVADSDRQALVDRLLHLKSYDYAYEVWSAGNSNKEQSGALLVNGGFEFEVGSGSYGFGWPVPGNLSRVSVVRDPQQPKSGAYSLRADFQGNSDPNIELSSQLVLVTGGANYQLDFVARSRNLVTGGPPFVEVRDGATAAVLAQSRTLPADQPNWEQYSLQFSAPTAARAVIIVIKRANCSSSPCPAFGQAWFDNFVFSPR